MQLMLAINQNMVMDTSPADEYLQHSNQFGGGGTAGSNGGGGASSGGGCESPSIGAAIDQYAAPSLMVLIRLSARSVDSRDAGELFELEDWLRSSELFLTGAWPGLMPGILLGSMLAPEDEVVSRFSLIDLSVWIATCALVLVTILVETSEFWFLRSITEPGCLIGVADPTGAWTRSGRCGTEGVIAPMGEVWVGWGFTGAEVGCTLTGSWGWANPRVLSPRAAIAAKNWNVKLFIIRNYGSLTKLSLSKSCPLKGFDRPPQYTSTFPRAQGDSLRWKTYKIIII